MKPLNFSRSVVFAAGLAAMTSGGAFAQSSTTTDEALTTLTQVQTARLALF